MPLHIVVVEKDRVYSKIRELRERGYTCRADEGDDWECTKPINEIQVDVYLLITK